MISVINISKERRKIILIIFFVFIFLIFIYKWQVSTSNSYLFLGNINNSKEDYDEALRNYKYTMVIKGSKDAVYEARIQRAKIFYDHGELENARQELLMAIDEKKSDSIVYEIMGDIYYTERNINNAIIYYNKSEQINSSKDVKIKLGKSFIAINKNEKAFDMFFHLSLDSDDSEILYYLGLLDFYNNFEYNSFFQQVEKKGSDYEFELKMIKEFLENYRDIKDERYKNILVADLYNKINQPYLAIGKINEIGGNDLSYRDAWLIMGKSNFILGNYEASFDNFQKASDIDSHNLEIAFWLKSSLGKIKNK
ncbi:MAG: hypothetical protein KAI67_03140 [Candidatus Pacebacteria bacterium]|nr:hypothetical protein [Candidatus Paceibacterota bacterium]